MIMGSDTFLRECNQCEAFCRCVFIKYRSLELVGTELRGTLPSDWGNLTALTYADKVSFSCNIA